MQLYKVRLVIGHTAMPSQNVNGYLGSDGQLCIYSRGGAIDKARLFAGKIEKHGKNYIATEHKVLMINKAEISPAIVKEMEGRESHKDTDDTLTEHIYYGSVFSDILENKEVVSELPSELVDELHILETLTLYYAYIILVP